LNLTLVQETAKNTARWPTRQLIFALYPVKREKNGKKRGTIEIESTLLV